MARQSGRVPVPNFTSPRSQYIREKGTGLFYNVRFVFWRHLPVSLGAHNIDLPYVWWLVRLIFDAHPWLKVKSLNKVDISSS
ncbi:uncharacterized protein BDW43DRAFT_285770 [Aspergillus alliaceus]|uniref:uncharacterized protein n=1 Tax=Petromyces alliaceus TaxID=209559 RepID=UPI0012A740C0|nr:uncharacterized protein BDW43DRAFT_285770 [Aspergillus alliaceus]KAB8230343.1 hypothetical protein BDW43DRAFT_285770 [Aspergillus alliaceus]